MHSILFKLGPVTIYTYGFMILIGALSAYFYCTKSANRYGLSKEFVGDLFFWCVLFGFFGARLTYILLDVPGFIQNPLDYLFTTAGFVFFGGVIGGVITLIFYCKKKRQDILAVCEMSAPAITVAHAFGRIGCFFYGCCYGKSIDSKICLLFPPESPAGFHGHPVIPTQLISALGLFILFGFLVWLSKRKLFRGVVTASYLIIYGIMRFSIEFLRGDPRGFFGPLATSQWLSIIAIIIGIILYFKFRRNDVS